MNTAIQSPVLKKILFLIFLYLFHCQVFSQTPFDQARRDTADEQAHSTALLKSASVLKMNIFAPLLGYSQFSWEKYISHKSSLELGLGIIGAGKNLNIDHRWFLLSRDYIFRPGHRNQFGGFLELGFKFVKRVRTTDMPENHFDVIDKLAGAYMKPSLIIGAYSFNQFSEDSIATKVRRHHSFAALLLNVGKQWAVSHRILFELYAGGGAEVDNVKDADDLYGHPFVLAVAKDNPTVNFACTVGFRFGFLFK